MMPVLFRIPGLNWNVPGYGLALTVGFLLTVLWAVRRATRSQADPDVILNCAFIALLGGVVGARAMFVYHYWSEFAYRGSAFDVFLAVIDVRKGGLEVYGGVLLAMGGALIYLLARGHSLRWYLDIVAPSTALGMGLGRIGCFLNGCCFGHVCDLPWAMRFPFGSSPAVEQWYAGEPGMDVPRELMYFPPAGIGPDGHAAFLLSREVLWLRDADIAGARATAARLTQEAQALAARLEQAPDEAERRQLKRQIARLRRQAAGIPHQDVLQALESSGLSLGELQALARQFRSRPVHPTQLYSVVTLVLLALLLDALYWRRRRDGQVFCAFLVLEPMTRYVLEVVRADNPVDTLGTFTISQFLAVVMSAVGLLGLVALRFLPPRSPRARPWEPPEEAAAGAPARAGGRRK